MFIVQPVTNNEPEREGFPIATNTLADPDPIAQALDYVFFFASLEEGRQWTSAHPGTYLLTLDQAFELGHRKNRRQYLDVLTEI